MGNNNKKYDKRTTEKKEKKVTSGVPRWDSGDQGVVSRIDVTTSPSLSSIVPFPIAFSNNNYQRNQKNK